MKKQKYFKLFIASALVVVGATSCSKDFLEVEPYGKTSTEAYYKTDEEVSLALIAAYDMLSSDQFQGWTSPVLTRVVCSEETNCGGADQSDQPHYQDMDKFRWQPDNIGFKAYYSKPYYGIYRCNEILTNGIDVDATKRYFAETKFLRAYYFFELTTAFGAIPMPLVPAENLKDVLPRTPQATVYAQIVKDLTEAIAVLPDKSAYSAADKFRASKQAAQALLGKVYLYMGENAKAITAFESVIAKQGSEVGLEPDFASVTRVSTEFGKESLFEASFISIGATWGNTSWDRNADDNRMIQLSGPRSLSPGTSGILEGWGFIPPRAAFFNALDDADPRKLNTIISNQQLKDLYGGNLNVTWDTEGMIRTKYTSFQSELGTGGDAPLNFATNWRLIRYADVLLLAAEAYQKTGNNAQALIEINKVRARAGVAAAATTGSATFDLIVKERQIELAFEGHRYFDLMRWNREGLISDAALTQILGTAFSEKNKLFPIPKDEMLGNTALSPADQNPGY